MERGKPAWLSCNRLIAACQLHNFAVDWVMQSLRVAMTLLWPDQLLSLLSGAHCDHELWHVQYLQNQKTLCPSWTRTVKSSILHRHHLAMAWPLQPTTALWIVQRQKPSPCIPPSLPTAGVAAWAAIATCHYICHHTSHDAQLLWRGRLWRYCMQSLADRIQDPDYRMLS